MTPDCFTPFGLNFYAQAAMEAEMVASLNAKRALEAHRKELNMSEKAVLAVVFDDKYEGPSRRCPSCFKVSELKANKIIFHCPKGTSDDCPQQRYAQQREFLMNTDKTLKRMRSTQGMTGNFVPRPESVFLSDPKPEPTNEESKMWKFIQFAIAAAFVYGTAYAQDAGVKTPLPPIYPQTPASQTPAPVTPGFETGFCAGWNASVQVEQQRYNNWRTLVTATRTDEGAKTPVGQVADLLTNSVAVYVLMQPATGQLTLGDGRVINCAAPAAPMTGDKK